MQWLSNKNLENRNKIAWLGALTLLFSYAELFIPKIMPFFKLGLANIPVMAGFTLSPLSFVVLLVIKALCSCMMAGTLFSPFFVISLLQSLGSGILMYLLFHMNEKIQTGALGKSFLSIYGISIAGSALSGVIQIGCSSVYLGEGTAGLLGPMLLFSAFSGFLTAVLYCVIDFPLAAPELKDRGDRPLDAADRGDRPLETAKPHSNLWLLLKITFLLASALVIFMLDSWKVLLPVMVVCLAIQCLSGRKILFLPYIFLWLFILITSVIIPQGKIIFAVWKIRITYGALMSGVNKAMILTSVAALSQCMTGLRFTDDRFFITLVFKYYKRLQDSYKNAEGNFLEKLKTAICS